MADSKSKKSKAGVKDVAGGKDAGKAPSKSDAKGKTEAAATSAAKTKVPKVKAKLDAGTKKSLEARAAKKAKQPRFRRHEWWRYVKLGGKHASWRVPRGIHSKTRRHFGYRPPLVSIGYRGPADVRGLHPSGFEEVLVHTVDEVAGLDKAKQAARIGGTVGGRKAELIVKKADELGVRVLNRGGN